MPQPGSPLLPSSNLFPSSGLYPNYLGFAAGNPPSGTQTFSGVVVDQNAVPEDSLDTLSTGLPSYLTLALSSASGVGPVYQTFQLPGDFARGDTGSVLPPLTGLQLYLAVPNAAAATTAVMWKVDVQESGAWVTLASGTTTGTAQSGNTWFNIFFTSPVAVSAQWLTATFRIVVYYSTAPIYYSVPNPLSQGQAFYISGAPVTDATRTLSLMFRVLAGVADGGIDFLGNVYRSAVTTSSPANVSVLNTSDANTFWVSQPNPSRFAVESLYVDARQNGQAGVIDRITLDPLTPGVYFTIYYSSDPTGPGVDAPSWDSLLWTPVYKTFQATRKATYALPQPITADYLKIEFSSLQARSYDPGNFQVPTTYRKHPKWVLDYFLARFATQLPDIVASGVDITYDALDLAFTYYQGDLANSPDAPTLSSALTLPQIQFFQQEDASNQVDPTTLSQIRVAFQPFRSQPALLGRLNTVLGRYTSSVATSNYPTEVIQTVQGNTSIVSTLQREPLLIEKGFPVMFFYVPCRHAYRISKARFAHNIGYFAGVKELTLHRDVYTNGADAAQYNEVLGDGANLQLNDWTQPLASLS